MGFADRLRDAMDARGLTQGQLEVKSGVRQATISRIMNGVNTPAVDVAAALARALGVSLDWLCGLPQDKPNLTPDEDELLQSYRAIPSSASKQFILRMVRDLPK